MHLDSLLKLPTKESWQKDWWLLLFAKLLLCIALPFFSDEAYYWTWSHNLKLSYFDHPPFISWLFLLGRPLENFFFAARLPTVLLGHFTLWIWCAGLAVNYSPSNKRKLFWILSLHTLTGFGSLVANPDVPFLFFWSLSILFYLRSLENLSSRLWPSLLGAALGLGFASKYLLALFVPAVVIHLLGSGKWRLLKWHNIAIPVVLGAFFSGTVWFWNFQNDWQSFKFQVDHGLGKPWNLRWTGDFMLGTIFLLFPPFVYFFIRNKIYRSTKNFHVVLFLFLLAFFIYTTTGGSTELNWPLALYPSFFFLVVPFLEKSFAYKAFIWIFGLFGSFLIATSLLNPAKTIHPRLVEWALYEKIYSQAQGYEPLYTSTYQSASYFWFLTKQPYYKLRYASRLDEYDFMPGSQPNASVFYFLKEQYQIIPDEQKSHFDFIKVKDLDNNFEIYKAIKK